tara:strand:+ start:343 stop:741 length:399 start_codon:yes stop_codon:yes gene_type:complete
MENEIPHSSTQTKGLKKECNMNELVKYLKLAKSASDAGKGFGTPKSTACTDGYRCKDDFILKAIAVARKQNKVRVGSHWDHGTMVIIFDIQAVGCVGFHTMQPDLYEHLRLQTISYCRRRNRKVWSRLRRSK